MRSASWKHLTRLGLKVNRAESRYCYTRKQKKERKRERCERGTERKKKSEAIRHGHRAGVPDLFLACSQKDNAKSLRARCCRYREQKEKETGRKRERERHIERGKTERRKRRKKKRGKKEGCRHVSTGGQPSRNHNRAPLPSLLHLTRLSLFHLTRTSLYRLHDSVCLCIALVVSDLLYTSVAMASRGTSPSLTFSLSLFVTAL